MYVLMCTQESLNVVITSIFNLFIESYNLLLPKVLTCYYDNIQEEYKSCHGYS